MNQDKNLIEPHSTPDWVSDHLEGATGRGIRVGVIDSGWDHSLDVPDVEKGVGFVDPDNDLATKKTEDSHDRIGHGTVCGNLIRQIAPDASLHPVRVFGDKLETSPSTLGAAIKWTIEQDLDVVNISLGTLQSDVVVPLFKICEKARKNDILLVASRHNKVERSYPSVFENVISVGIGPIRNPFSFLYRPGHAVECLAKGRLDQIPWTSEIRQPISRTSFAAPRVTGIIALFRERYPDADLETTRTLLDRFSDSEL